MALFGTVPLALSFFKLVLVDVIAPLMWLGLLTSFIMINNGLLQDFELTETALRFQLSLLMFFYICSVLLMEGRYCNQTVFRILGFTANIYYMAKLR